TGCAGLSCFEQRAGARRRPAGTRYRPCDRKRRRGGLVSDQQPQPARTLDPRRLQAAGHLALGSDSRLSGARDLLEELRVVADIGALGAREALALATTDAARILRMPQRGVLAAGAPADLLIVADRGGDAARSVVG